MSIFHSVLDASNRRKDGIDWNQANRLVWALIFLASGKTATDAYIKLGVELVLLVQSANELLRVEHFKTLNGLDVAGIDLAFFVYNKGEFFRLMILANQLEPYLFYIQLDVRHA